MGEMTKVAQESLSALRTVQAFNANDQEQEKFHERINKVLTLARKEAVASGIFFGSTGWSGNMTILGLLGYGESECEGCDDLLTGFRWNPCLTGCHHCRRPYQSTALHGICRERSSDAHVRYRFYVVPFLLICCHGSRRTFFVRIILLDPACRDSSLTSLEVFDHAGNRGRHSNL
jgi:hypothetical protein